MLWVNMHYRGWMRYILAFIMPVAAFFTRAGLLKALGGSLPYVTFFPAVMIAALYGGLYTGLVATAVSAGIIAIWILEDAPSFVLAPYDWPGMVVFIGSGIMTSFLCQAMYSTRTKLTERTQELILSNARLAKELADRKQMEQALSRLDRLNLVGQMAASMGHEIRNPMTTVRGYLQMLKTRQSFIDYGDRFDLMIEELDRANSIITEYLSLAGNKYIEKEYQSLNQLIETIYPLLQADGNVRGHSIVLTLKTIPHLWLDTNEIRQLLINLVRNSMEAIGRKGTISIRTYVEKGNVVLVVQDNGPGIPQVVMENFGTPFITTKTHGTGLGIPVCFQIAQHHQATIEVASNTSGVTVYIKFKI